MKIQFEQKDKELFFNMVSSQKIFGELVEKYKLKDIEIPLSSIDVIISCISSLIIGKKFFQVSFDIEEEKLRSIISFMLGTGEWEFNPSNPIWSFFIKDFIPYANVKIQKNELWEFLLENGLEV